MSRIVVHASIDQLKADKKFAFVEVKEEHFANASKIENHHDSGHKYLPLLNLLPDGYRLVFSMRVMEDLPHKEIAKILGIKESTSRTQLLKARKMLKKIIDQKRVLI